MSRRRDERRRNRLGYVMLVIFVALLVALVTWTMLERANHPADDPVRPVTLLPFSPAVDGHLEPLRS